MPSRCLKSSWLESFQDFLQGVEAPDQYVFWSGIAVLSAALKRHAFYKRKMQVIYPNHYIVLVGDPGTGKGSAMIPALNLMRKSGTCNLLYDRMSAEKMVEIIANGFGQLNVTPHGTIKLGGADTSVCIYEDELSVLFGISDWMLDCLNRLWTEGYFKYDTKSGHEVEIVNNATTILGGCIPEFLKNISRTKATASVSSGFTSRTIFSFSSIPARSQDYWGEDSTLQSSVSESDLVEDLKYIATYCGGEYQFDTKARALLAEFNDQIKSDVDAQGNLIYESDIVRYFKNRISTHVGKLALLLSASEQDSKIVEAHHVRTAIDKLTQVKNDLDIAFRFIGESKDVEAQTRVLDFIERKGQTNRAEVLRYLKNHVTGDQLDRILTVLVEVGIIRYTSNIGTSIRNIILNTPTTPNRTKSAKGGYII